MDYRVYSTTKPDGVVFSADVADFWFSMDLLIQVDRDGVVRTPCPCCDKRIVVRQDGIALDDQDRAYLAIAATIPETSEGLTATIDIGPHPGGPLGG